MMKRGLLLSVLLLALLGPHAARAQSGSPAAEPADSVGMLRPGDVIHIAVWREPELSGEFQIAADGTILHPLYRAVRVAGLPITAVEARLETFLERYESNPEFVLEPRFRVWVGGEVQSPRLYTLPPEVTVSDAVALAGGPTGRGRLDRVRVVRRGEEFFVDLTEPGPAPASIRSGDRITVTRRSSLFRDYILPAASITSALVTVVHLVLRLSD